MYNLHTENWSSSSYAQNDSREFMKRQWNYFVGSAVVSFHARAYAKLVCFKDHDRQDLKIAKTDSTDESWKTSIELFMLNVKVPRLTQILMIPTLILKKQLSLPLPRFKDYWSLQSSPICYFLLWFEILLLALGKIELSHFV